MRLILFRGKKADGEWVYGDLIKYLEPGRKYGIWTESDGIIIVIPKTIGQFTGLTDKNGVKIFEGDVCKDRYGKNGAVEYFNDFGGFIVKYKLPDSTLHIQLDQGRNKFEAIGNIHDNPGLL